MSPRWSSVWLVALLASPVLAPAADPPVSATDTALLRYRASTYVWHDLRLDHGEPDLFERTFPRMTRPTSLRDCHDFDCYLQNSDTKRLVDFPREERIWASATGHQRPGNCGSEDDLVSVFERYDGCEPFLRRVDHAIVTLPRDTPKQLPDENGDETAPKQVDRRPAAPAPVVERLGRGAVIERDRAGRR